jgi:RimJ/RimL family protein N-acetyltransferase
VTARAPFIVTERLELWQPQLEDMETMFAIIGEPETGRHLGRNLDFADHFLRFFRNAGSWQLCGYGGLMVRFRGEPEVLGNCGIFYSWRGIGPDFDGFPEAGWILRADAAGKGIAGESMRAILDWFDREHSPRRVVAMIDPDNAPSIGLAGKLGFTAMRQATAPDGEEVILFERVP